MTPDFYIIGAPKCGTTSLAAWLGQHSEIEISNPKEPHGFADDVAGEISREDYGSIFSTIDPDKLRGEASTWYLWSQSAVPNILSENPDAKFVVCLRNPAEMAWSMHGHHVFKGEDNISDFEQAWSLQDERRRGKHLPFRMRNPVRVQYSEACSTGTQLERLFSLVSRDKVLVVFLDEISASPSDVFRRVEAFLNLASQDVEFFRANSARERRFPAIYKAMTVAGKIKHALGIPAFNTGIGKKIEAGNEQPSRRGKMPEHVREFLNEHFSSEVMKIEELTGRNLSHWSNKLSEEKK